MTIKIKTEYTKAIHNRFVWFDFTERKPRLVLLCVVELMALCVLCFAIFVEYYLLHSPNLTTVMRAIAINILSLWTLLCVPLLAMIRGKKAYGFMREFTFTDNEVRAHSKTSTAEGTATYQYAHFRRVYETRESLYFYVAPGQAFVFRKEDIIEGSMDELRGLLMAKLPPKKYILKLSRK